MPEIAIETLSNKAPHTITSLVKKAETSTPTTENGHVFDEIQLSPKLEAATAKKNVPSSGVNFQEQESIRNAMAESRKDWQDGDVYGKLLVKHAFWNVNKRVQQFEGTPQEKDVYRKQIEQENDEYFEQLKTKQDVVVEKYWNTPSFQDYLLNGISPTYYQPENYDPSVFKDPESKRSFVEEYLTKQVRENGVTLTEQERDAYPGVASWEYATKNSNYKTRTKSATENFNVQLRESGISLKENESFCLNFDQNFKFKISGIDNGRAEKLEKLINSNINLRATLVDSLYGRYEQDGTHYIRASNNTSFEQGLLSFKPFQGLLTLKNVFEEKYNYSSSDVTFCGYIGNNPIYQHKDGTTASKDETDFLNQIRKQEEGLPTTFSGFEQSPITYKNDAFHAFE